MIIEGYCNVCKKVTNHDQQKDIKEEIKTTITVCKECGNAEVDCGAIYNDDIEMDCLVCNLKEDDKCNNCMDKAGEIF